VECPLNSKKEPWEEEKFLERVTVYLSPRLKEEMEAYRKANGYRSLSEMLRRGFFVLKQVFGSQASFSSREQDVLEQLDRIEQRLEEIRLESEAISDQERAIEREVSEMPSDEIPSFDDVASSILKLLTEFNGLKDFILMEHLRSKYSEGIIWATLLKLKKDKKIELKDGAWKIIGQ